MGKAVGHHLATAGTLQGIIANLGGGIHGLFHITLFEQLARGMGVVSPTALPISILA